MSNYGTSYNINQAGDLYTIQDHDVAAGLGQYNSTRGTTVNSPTNYRKMKLYRGFDNQLFFFIKNQDRKPIQLNNMSINASLIYRETSVTILSKRCQITDYELGSVKLVVSASELSNTDTGICDLVLSYTNEFGLVIPLYTDLNMRPNFAVEISDEAGYIPLTTQVIDTFVNGTNFNYSSIITGPAYYSKSNGMITVGVYATNYTGEFYLQGTTSQYPAETDWFDIELGAQYYYHSFDSFTGIEPFTIQSNLKFMRTKIGNTSAGTVDKIVVRV
jgi:hypothetical protein